VHGDSFTFQVWAYLAMLLMVWFKTPALDEVIGTIVVTGYTICALLVGTRVLEMTGAIPMASVSEGLVGFEKEHYWLPLSGWLGPEGRWPGPFGHNAKTGNIAAYLVVIGVALRTRSGVIFGIVGAVTLLLTSSRGSFVAAAIGVALVVLLGDYRWNRRLNRGVLVVSLLVVAIAAASLAVLASPNLTGRTTYWPAFLKLWQSSPLVGVGFTGKQAGDPIISGTNGHNLLIDVLAKYGILGLVPVVVALFAIAYICFRASTLRYVLPLGVVVTFLVIGLSESDYGWMEPSIPWLLLVLAAVAGSRWVESRETSQMMPPDSGSTESLVASH